MLPERRGRADDRDIPHYMPWENPFLTEDEKRVQTAARRSPWRSGDGPARIRQPGWAAAAVPSHRLRRPERPVAAGRHGACGRSHSRPGQRLDAGRRRAGTSPCRSVTRACCWWIRARLAARTLSWPPSATITAKPIRYIINTSAAPESIGNNGVLARAARRATERGNGRGPTPAVIAHEKVLTRMTASDGGRRRYPVGGWPTDAYLLQKRSLYFNGEAIDIIHQPSAYSDGDSIVHFRRSDVIVDGRSVTTTHFPRSNPAHGGSYQGVLNSLNAMLDIAVPRMMQEGGTYIVPGQGRVCDEADLAEVGIRCR